MAILSFPFALPATEFIFLKYGESSSSQNATCAGISTSRPRFAVFETDRESDVDNLADTIRMFSRCVFYGWIKEHRDMVSLQNFTFERYINKKVYIYVPISVK